MKQGYVPDTFGHIQQLPQRANLNQDIQVPIGFDRNKVLISMEPAKIETFLIKFVS
jgi:hypothetical protein